MTVHDLTVRRIDGREISLSDYAGCVLLIVNTASRCGFTGQYRGLQTLHERYHGRGLRVLAFPSNDFLKQEPGTDAQIQTFCSTRFAVTFDLFSKICVKGEQIHPLYRRLTGHERFGGRITWNFNKFVADPGGEIVARFGTWTRPLSKKIIRALEDRLPAAPGS